MGYVKGWGGDGGVNPYLIDIFTNSQKVSVSNRFTQTTFRGIETISF